MRLLCWWLALVLLLLLVLVIVLVLALVLVLVLVLLLVQGVLFEEFPASSPLLLYCNGIVLGKPVSGVVVMGERICVCWWLWWYSTIGFVIPTCSCGVPLATCTYSVQRLFDMLSETL
jgi:hypothetical protein